MKLVVVLWFLVAAMPWSEDSWSDGVNTPGPISPAVRAGTPQRSVPTRTPRPRTLGLTWSNGALAAGLELMVASNLSVGSWCVDTDMIGSSVTLTNLPWGTNYFFGRALPSTNGNSATNCTVEGQLTYLGSFSAWDYEPALYQSNILVKWLTNCPDGQSHIYSGLGLSARIVAVPRQ